MSLEQPGGGGLRRSEMKDFHVLPVSRLLSSAGGLHRQGGDVWKAQAEEESLGREGRRETAPCTQSSVEQAGCAITLLLKSNLKASDFPLIFKQVKNSVFAFILLLLSSEAPAGIRSPHARYCSALGFQTPSARVCSLTGSDRQN